MKFQKIYRPVIAVLAIIIGLYPLIYYFIDMHGAGLLASKTPELLSSKLWHINFYLHISFGGIALLTGWTQFIDQWRVNNPKRHRLIGKVYIASVLISSIAGFYIALFATGGTVSTLGFSLLALVWLYSGNKAYYSAIKKEFQIHRNWMIRNYALTFAAVTLRIYLPLSQLAHINFIDAYRTIAWLAWIPNLIIAEIIIARSNKPDMDDTPANGL